MKNTKPDYDYVVEARNWNLGDKPGILSRKRLEEHNDHLNKLARGQMWYGKIEVMKKSLEKTKTVYSSYEELRKDQIMLFNQLFGLTHGLISVDDSVLVDYE